MTAFTQPPAPPALRATPTEAEWRAMPLEARRRFLAESMAALEEQASLAPEGRPHTRAKNQALDKLGRHFQRTGRLIYLASELPVYYPGERPFAPDLMAVLDVADPGEQDERTAWMVSDEGRGLDLVLEVYFSGDWHKDFERNVVAYARMGIPEYFLYDRRHQSLHGYRLPTPGARHYQKLKLRCGRLTSQVLGLDLALLQGRLRLYSGDAELPDSDELLDRVGSMVDDVQQRREEAETRATQEAERAERILAQLRATVLDILGIRGLEVDEELAQRIAACSDDSQLRRWASRAVTATASRALLEG